FMFFSVVFFFSSRRRHTRSKRDWSSDVCSSDLFYLKQLPQFYLQSFVLQRHGIILEPVILIHLTTQVPLLPTYVLFCRYSDVASTYLIYRLLSVVVLKTFGT